MSLLSRAAGVALLAAATVAARAVRRARRQRKALEDLARLPHGPTMAEALSELEAPVRQRAEHFRTLHEAPWRALGELAARQERVAETHTLPQTAPEPRHAEAMPYDWPDATWRVSTPDGRASRDVRVAAGWHRPIGETTRADRVTEWGKWSEILPANPEPQVEVEGIRTDVRSNRRSTDPNLQPEVEGSAQATAPPHRTDPTDTVPTTPDTKDQP